MAFWPAIAYHRHTTYILWLTMDYVHTGVNDGQREQPMRNETTVPGESEGEAPSPARFKRVSRKRLLHAWGIVEYDDALRHMQALKTAGVTVPKPLIEETSNRLELLLQRWPEKPNGVLRQNYLNEARLLVQECLPELDHLLREKGVQR